MIVPIEKRLGVEALVAVIMNFNSEGIEKYKDLVGAFHGDGYNYAPKKLDLDLKNRIIPPALPSIKEPPVL